MLLWFLMTMPVWAGELPQPPPLQEEPMEERRFLKAVYDHHNNLVGVTANPNGSRRGNPNDVIRANFVGSNYLCVNTGAGMDNTTWQCVALSTP